MDGERIVTIDSVTSFHLMYTLQWIDEIWHSHLVERCMDERCALKIESSIARETECWWLSLRQKRKAVISLLTCWRCSVHSYTQ